MKIRGALEAEGACLVGFADISRLGLPVTHEYPFGICFAIRYDDAVVNQLPNDEPWLQMASSLTDRAKHIYQVMEELLQSWGYHLKQIDSGIRQEDFPDPGEELPQKTLATLSGLGWIGRSTLLVSPRFGPRIRLGMRLTDMPLETDNPIVQSQCGDCRICVDACPANAIKGNSWSQETPRSELLDLSLCYNYLWKDRAVIGRRQTCGICLKVCPIGQNNEVAPILRTG